MPSTMETPDSTSPTPIMYFVYVLIALTAVGLCALVGAIIYCVFKLTLHWKEGSLRESNVKHEYYEVIDPIYEVLRAGRATDLNHAGIQIKMENNDAYKSLELKEANPHAHNFMGIDVENNQAYGHVTSEFDVLQMGHNKCYEAAPFNCNISVIPERVATSTLECYQTQSMCCNENIQQASSGQLQANCTYIPKQ